MATTGNDLLHAPAVGNIVLFGDLNEVAAGTVTTGNDRILSGISGIQTLIGDVVTVTNATLHAGHDLLDSRRLAGGRSALTGDVDVATVSTSLTSIAAGADRLFGSLTLGDKIVGDVRELTGVRLEAGNDTVHGGGGNDQIHGDVAAAHGTDIGVDSGLFGVLNLEGGADTLAGEDGNDLIYGDVGNFDDFTGSLLARLQGGSDAIRGGAATTPSTAMPGAWSASAAAATTSFMATTATTRSMPISERRLQVTRA